MFLFLQFSTDNFSSYLQLVLINYLTLKHERKQYFISSNAAIHVYRDNKKKTKS